MAQCNSGEQPPVCGGPLVPAKFGNGQSDAAQVRRQAQLTRSALGQGDRDLTLALASDHAFGQTDAKLVNRALRQGYGAFDASRAGARAEILGKGHAKGHFADQSGPRDGHSRLGRRHRQGRRGHMPTLDHKIGRKVAHLSCDLKLHIAGTDLVDQGQVDMGLDLRKSRAKFHWLACLFQILKRRLIQQRQHRSQRCRGLQTDVSARRSGRDIWHLEHGARHIH